MAQRALVTGASSGIGEEFAKRLAAEGWSVTGVARGEGKLAEGLKALPGSGHKALGADLSTPQGVAIVANELATNRHQLLVNNAGVGLFGLFDKTPIEKVHALTRLSINAVYELAHAYLKDAQSGDALINVSSMMGMMPFPGQAAYSGSKAFIVAMSESLWFEMKPRGVYVMALCPGVTKTNFIADGGGAESEVPKAIVGTVEMVVGVALAALKKRKLPVVVPGGLNKVFIFSSRVLSRKAMMNMMGGMAPKSSLK